MFPATVAPKPHIGLITNNSFKMPCELKRKIAITEAIVGFRWLLQTLIL